MGRAKWLPAVGGKEFQAGGESLQPSYTTIEVDGYVYARLADAEDALLNHLRCDITVSQVTVRLINHFNNTVTNCVENFIDIPHTVYVHPGIFVMSATRDRGGYYA